VAVTFAPALGMASIMMAAAMIARMLISFSP
jgi:hypothetical protein